MVYNFNNKAILDALLKYYGINREIEESDKSNIVKNLLNRFRKENLDYFAHVAPWLKNLTLKLEPNTQESRQPSTLQALSAAQMIRNCIELISKLFSSARNGDLETVKYLVETAKVDVNAEDRDGDTVFMVVCKNGHLDVVRYLVETAKADVNIQDAHGCTVLIRAAENKRWDVVKYLVKEGNADVNVVTLGHSTPLILAAEDGVLDVVRCLINEGGAKVNIENYYQSALTLAAYNGRLDVVKCLVKEGNADVNTKDENGNTPLMLAAQEGHLGIVKYLVETKADINVKSYGYGNTALTYATKNGHLDVEKYLTDRIQEINKIELWDEYICIRVCSAVGFITGFAVAYHAQAAIAMCVTSAVTGLLLGAAVSYVAIEVKKEKCKDPDIGVVTALKNVFITQRYSPPPERVLS